MKDMEENKQIITKEGLAKLQNELDELILIRRKEIAAKIKEAREQGDLSENAEYDTAKDEQRNIEARIEEIEEIIKNSVVLDEKSINYDKVHVGCVTTIQDMKTKKTFDYSIVVPMDVDSLAGKISYQSPVGKALMDKEVGDVVEVNAPVGIIKYKILNIVVPQK